MLDWLVRIPGPEFLLYFSLMACICTIITWWLVRASDGEHSLPDGNKLEPIAVAALRGGWQAVIDTVIVQLIEREVVSIVKEPTQQTLVIQKKTTELTPTEAVVYNYLLIPRMGSEFKGVDMEAPMETALQPVYQELEKSHLYKTEEELFNGQVIAYVMMFCLNIMAMSKIYFALKYNKPLLFLVIIMFIINVAIFKIVKPNDRITRLGYKLIKTMNEHFAWLKTNASQSHGTYNYALGAAIFGIGALAAYELLDGSTAFAQERRNSGVNGSSDGGSGGCGSGGDSGSGCSSGCGGCGGD